MGCEREAQNVRKTRETEVTARLAVDGCGQSSIATGIPFFDHMLEQVSRHGLMDIDLKCIGDVEIDWHHTVEDSAIALGTCLKEALGEKSSINRYGFASVVHDEAWVVISLDLSGRPYLEAGLGLMEGAAGQMDRSTLREFFRALCNAAGITLHLRVLAGENPHHIAEASFKALGRALRVAAAPDAAVIGIPSSKGVL